VPIAAIPRGTADGLARDGGRRAPAVLATATPRRAISTLAYDDGRRTPADVTPVHDEALACRRSRTRHRKPPAEACSPQARRVAPKPSIAAQIRLLQKCKLLGKHVIDVGEADRHCRAMHPLQPSPFTSRPMRSCTNVGGRPPPPRATRAPEAAPAVAASRPQQDPSMGKPDQPSPVLDALPAGSLPTAPAGDGEKGGTDAIGEEEDAISVV
jgi:hypothetical protein